MLNAAFFDGGIMVSVYCGLTNSDNKLFELHVLGE